MPKLWNTTIEAHRQAVRLAAIEATAGLVAEHGLRSVTMSKIAELTGIGRATLYKYFPDVEAILVAWHEGQVAAHLDHLIDMGNDVPGAGSRLEAVLDAYAFIVHKRGHHAAELSTALHRGDAIAQAHKRLHAFIQELLTRAATEGVVRSDVAPGELADYTIHALATAASLPSTAAVQRLLVVVLAGLRPSSAAPTESPVHLLAGRSHRPRMH